MATEGQPQAPSAFGRYTLLERLAVGGMAEVFRAKITSSHGFEKILVIKRILPHLAADPNFVSMFIDEAKLTAQLTHPKIVQVLDFGEVRGQYFTALEYIDGFDALGLLRVAAQKRVHIPRTLAVFIVSEVLEALDYAHNARDMEGKSMQIVHRDISPSNIFISKRGDVKLGDFGIAHAQRRESKTQAGTLKGKYGYMSPEQVVGRADRRAQRSVRGRRRAGRAADRAPAVLRAGRSRRAAEGPRREAGSPRQVRRRPAQAAGPHRPPRAEEGPARALLRPRRSLRDELSDYLFSVGQRVGPSDLRAFTGTLFDTSPDAAARLLQEARRMGTAKAGAKAEAAAAARARTFSRRRLRRPARPAPASFPQTPTQEADVVSDMPTAETADAPSQGSWPDDEVSDRSSAPGFTPVSRPGDTRQVGAARTEAPGRATRHAQRRREVRLGGA